MSLLQKPLTPSGEPRIGVRGRRRNPESFENPGFRVALRLPGMTIFYCFQEFCGSLEKLSFDFKGLAILEWTFQMGCRIREEIAPPKYFFFL